MGSDPAHIELLGMIPSLRTLLQVKAAYEPFAGATTALVHF